jgi:hypothetical protein
MGEAPPSDLPPINDRPAPTTKHINPAQIKSGANCFQWLGSSIVSLSYFKLMLIDFQFNACGLFSANRL